MIAREGDFPTKQEGGTSDNNKISKPSSSSSITSWSRLKDPRIVRVSRAFGGKDRHSKVCTVRGLRDRRVRLSVPTAIQLYDLQDRLGLNQPSKVVDWLLDAAKHEIDELPPLQMPPGNFPQNLHHPMLNSHHSQKGLKINGGNINFDDLSDHPRLNLVDSKEVEEEKNIGKDRNWTRNEEAKDCDLESHHHGTYISSTNFLARPNQSSLAGLMNNSMQYNSFLRWDPSNLSLSHGGSHGLTLQPEEFHNFNIVPSGSQLVVYPPGVPHSYFPTNISGPEFDPKTINLQMLSSNSQNPFSNSLTQPVESSSQPVRPFHFGMTANLLQSGSHGERHESNKDNEFDSR